MNLEKKTIYYIIETREPNTSDHFSLRILGWTY